MRDVIKKVSSYMKKEFTDFDYEKRKTFLSFLNKNVLWMLIALGLTGYLRFAQVDNITLYDVLMKPNLYLSIINLSMIFWFFVPFYYIFTKKPFGSYEFFKYILYIPFGLFLMFGHLGFIDSLDVSFGSFGVNFYFLFLIAFLVVRTFLKISLSNKKGKLN